MPRVIVFLQASWFRSPKNFFLFCFFFLFSSSSSSSSSAAAAAAAAAASCFVLLQLGNFCQSRSSLCFSAYGYGFCLPHLSTYTVGCGFPGGVERAIHLAHFALEKNPCCCVGIASCSLFHSHLHE